MEARLRASGQLLRTFAVAHCPQQLRRRRIDALEGEIGAAGVQANVGKVPRSDAAGTPAASLR